MIQVAPQMRILVAIEAQDFRRGIDGLARVCRDQTRERPVQRHALRLPQPAGDGDQDSGV